MGAGRTKWWEDIKVTPFNIVIRKIRGGERWTLLYIGADGVTVTPTWPQRKYVTHITNDSLRRNYEIDPNQRRNPGNGRDLTTEEIQTRLAEVRELLCTSEVIGNLKEYRRLSEERSDLSYELMYRDAKEIQDNCFPILQDGMEHYTPLSAIRKPKEEE